MLLFNEQIECLTLIFLYLTDTDPLLTDLLLTGSRYKNPMGHKMSEMLINIMGGGS